MKRTPSKKSKSVSKVVSQSIEKEDIIRKTPQENKEILLGVSQSKFHQGPLPAPEDLFRYEKICPGAADRIIKMAEKEQKYLNKLRYKEYRSLRMGLIFGFISFIALIALTFSAIYYDKPWIAAVLIAAASTCGLFINQKNSNKTK